MNFCVGYTNMLVSKNAKICIPPKQNIKFALPTTQNPNAGQWNGGCVGSQMQNFRVGHVHFMFFVLISFALVTQRKPSLQWNMGLRETPHFKSPQWSLILSWSSILPSFEKVGTKISQVASRHCNRTQIVTLLPPA